MEIHMDEGKIKYICDTCGKTIKEREIELIYFVLGEEISDENNIECMTCKGYKNKT